MYSVIHKKNKPQSHREHEAFTKVIYKLNQYVNLNTNALFLLAKFAGK